MRLADLRKASHRILTLPFLGKLMSAGHRRGCCLSHSSERYLRDGATFGSKGCEMGEKIQT